MTAPRRWSTTVLVLSALVLGALTGCTRSLEMSYTPSLYRLPQADSIKGIVLGVAKLEDRRATIDRSDMQSLGYVMRQGAWKFGLTHGGKEFVPVADLVQRLFLDEFIRAGVGAKALPEILTKDGLPAMRDAGGKAGAGYVLGGRILVFEIVNDPGFWTVDSRRSITLELNLLRVRDSALVLDTTVSHNDSRNEGAGILHSTNVDRLMNTAFRQVVTQVVEQVAAKLALDPRDVRVRWAWER